MGRAVAVAAPAGLVIWLMANIHVDETSLLQGTAAVLEKPGVLLGMNGAVLLAFLLGSPANELVLPILMLTLTAGTGLGGESSTQMAGILLSNGWTWRESLCTLVFFLFHWPCTTTLLTIRKETGSRKWTFLALLLPTAFGCVLCILLRFALLLVP